MIWHLFCAPNLTNSPLDSRPPKACQLEWSEWSEWNFARGPSALWAPEHLHIPYTKPGMKDVKDVKDRNVRSTSSSSIECIVYRAIIPYFMLKDSQIYVLRILFPCVPTWFRQQPRSNVASVPERSTLGTRRNFAIHSTRASVAAQADSPSAERLAKRKSF